LLEFGFCFELIKYRTFIGGLNWAVLQLFGRGGWGHRRSERPFVLRHIIIM